MAEFNKMLTREHKDFSPEILLLIKGDWIDPDVFKNTDSPFKIIWFQDSAQRCGPNHISLSKIADTVFVFEATDIDYLSSNGVQKNKIHFLPMGFDKSVYKPLMTRKDVDVSFVGRMYENRKSIIDRLVNDFPEFNFKIFGRYVRYQEPKTWLEWLQRLPNKRMRNTYINRDIKPSSVNEVYNKSKIVLNIHHGQSKEGCNPRVFEISGSGSFQICDENYYVSKEMEDSVVQFKDYENLAKHIEHFLRDEESRKKLAARSFEISRLHTFNARIRVMLSLIRQI